jgi:phospholipase D1/2
MAKEIDVDSYTAQIVPDTKTTVSNQYFDMNQPFAFPRYGNECESYICGRDYMAAVAKAIRSAERFIFIADWQLDYDVELDQRGVAGHPGRLSELLADALQRGVHIRVLCYDSVNTATYLLGLFGKSGPPDTHEEITQSTLEDLPKGKGSIKVMLQNPNTDRGNAAVEFATKLPAGKEMNPNINFSHHQKFVVIDGKQVFLGGIDLAYGRWETPACDVVLNSNLHVLNDGYNMQITYARDATKAELDLTKKQSNSRPGFAMPHYSTGGKLIDPLTQPREPWNDVALSAKGPVAYDVFVNFVLRWNSFAKEWISTNVFDTQLTIDWFERQVKGHETLVNPLQSGAGKAAVQICRSASSPQLVAELDLWSNARKYIHDDWKQPNPERKKIVQEARKKWSSNHQTSIYDAMINCIRAAQAYIYIENQFFISDCGNDKHGTKHPAKNQIIAELANAIGQAIHKDRAFHVWIVLPEHPEGMLEAESTSSQAWWALQGIKHGKNSLINRINNFILEKNKKNWGVDKPINSSQDVTDLLKVRGMADKWREYLTVLNLRNYGQTTSGVLTEMIYVHSKLTIVDDAVAIIGSANINDRSLNGNGDTELAAVIVDDAQAEYIDLGQGVSAATRKFARDLRIKLWKKHLGMLIDTSTTGVQKEGGSNGINLEKPLDKASIKGIQDISTANRSAYSKVFTHTPRNEFGTFLDGRKKYPSLTKKVKKYEINGTPIGGVGPDGKLRDAFVWVDEPVSGQDFSKLPDLQAAYMKYGSHDIAKAIKELRADIKGFFVEMPLNWGAKELTTPKFPGGMPQSIAKNDPINSSSRSGTRSV